MIRSTCGVVFRALNTLNSCSRGSLKLGCDQVAARAFSILAQTKPQLPKVVKSHISVLGLPEVQNFVANPLVQQNRTVTRYGLSDGKRKSVRKVPACFKRLDWGIWIRRIGGSHHKLWKKSWKQRKRYQTHVFCNATQSYMLDKMVTPYWRSPKYYVEDPYEPYHKRENFIHTRSQPRPAP